MHEFMAPNNARWPSDVAMIREGSLNLSYIEELVRNVPFKRYDPSRKIFNV